MLKRFPIFLIVWMALFAASCSVLPTGEKKIPPKIEEAITTAFHQQAFENQDEEIVFLLFDTQIDYLEVSADQTQALVWFALLDKETGQVSGTEPGLVLAKLTGANPKDPQAWTLTFQHQPEWTTAVWEVEPELLETEEKQTFAGMAQVDPKTSQVYTGYKLPWEQGERAKLSGSIAHVLIYKTCPTTCLYAFDFWTGDMFPVHAAKSGIVKIAIWDVPNGETSATNYLLVEDTSTEPTTYAIYYHLAYDSIPEELRTPGTPVYQGQFIGNADDTGASTNHHLHFMVHTNPVSYWGSSVDIVFDEVEINDGRPRTCVEADLYPEYGDECIAGDWFYSDNLDNPPPTAWFNLPEAETTITTRTFTVEAEAQDDVAIKSISLYLRQSPAGWQEVAEIQNQNILTTEIDVCELGLADGTFELALEVVDVDGKVTRTYDNPHMLTKAVDCSLEPPACIPSSSQIALYTDTNYQGSCTLLERGEYYGMIYVPGIENDTVSSLLIGSETYAILYRDNNLKGIHEVFTVDEPDLSDNTLGDDTLSSLGVYTMPEPPTPPVLPDPFTAQEGEFIEISWTGNADEYYAELVKNEETLMTQDWSPQTAFPIGELDAGEYTLTVTARNLAGEAQSAVNFSVEAAGITQPQTQMLPLPVRTKNSVVTIQWTVTDGEDNVDHFEIQYRLPKQSWQVLNNAINAAERSLITVLEPGYTYQLQMRAIALQGPSESYPAIAETIITVADTCVSDKFEFSGDEEDQAVLTEGERQTHNFCPVGDEDRISVQIDSPGNTVIQVDPLENPLPIHARIEDPNGKTIQELEINDAVGAIEINPTNQQLGDWQLIITPFDEKIIGNHTAYEVYWKPDHHIAKILRPGILIALGFVAAFTVFLAFLLNKHKKD